MQLEILALLKENEVVRWICHINPLSRRERETGCELQNCYLYFFLCKDLLDG